MIQHRPDRPSPWVARVRTPSGQELSKTFRRKLDAQRWHDAQLTEMRAGEWVDPKLGEMSVEEWMKRVEQGKVGIADTTRRKRETLIRLHILPTWGKVSLAHVKPERIQEWIAGMEDELAPSTIHQIAVIFGEGLRRAVEYGRIRSDPTKYVRLPRNPDVEHRYLTGDEADELRDQLPEWYQLVVPLGTLAGLRPGEMLGLRWRDVDIDGRNIRVTGDHLKNRQSRRTVSIGTDLTDALLAHRAAYPSVGYVVHRDGSPVDRWALRRVWRPAVRASVGEPCRPYDMRHTHAAWLIEAGAHPRAIADRFGHSSITVTMDTYGGLMDSVRRDLGSLLDAGRMRNRDNPQSG